MTDSLSGSITLKRLKKGLNVVLTIETSGAALYQGYDPKTGNVSPDFTAAGAARPVLTPKAVAGNGNAASITNGSWQYNGTLLVVSGTADADGFTPCTDTHFAINTGTLQLKITGNIASKDNMSNDIFTFSGAGEAQGTDWEAQATAEMHLQEIGSSAVAIYISGGCTLSSFQESVLLTASLFISGQQVTTGYKFLWKDESGNVLLDGGNTYTATRDNVTAIGGIYCSAYLATDTTKTPLATDFHKITDLDDEYELEAFVDKEWDGTNIQTVTARIYKFSDGATGEEIESPTGTFTHTFVSSNTQSALGTKSGQSVSVGSEIWDQISDGNEDVVDFISYQV